MILIVLFISKAFIPHSAFKMKHRLQSCNNNVRPQNKNALWQQTIWRLAPDRRHLRLCTCI